MNFYLNAFATFFKIGLFTIGGGYAMVPLIEEEVVNKKNGSAKKTSLTCWRYPNPSREYSL